MSCGRVHEIRNERVICYLCFLSVICRFFTQCRGNCRRCYEKSLESQEREEEVVYTEIDVFDSNRLIEFIYDFEFNEC